MARHVEHASFFSYSVQRPYPLRWFTPVAIVGGIIFAALISFANFVASGYELTSVYASDPNVTDQNIWFRHWPSWLTGNIQATCQPANLPVNFQFFTNQTALSYTLTSITVAKDSASSMSPSLPYMNNVMKDCEIGDITMDFSCSQLQDPDEVAQTACTIDVRAYSTCSIDGPNGLTTFHCTSLYNPVPDQLTPGSSSLVGINATSRASLWWSQQLLVAYWLDTNIVLFDVLDPTGTSNNPYNNTKRGIVEGSATFYRNYIQEDILQLNFFNVAFHFDGLFDGLYYHGNNSVRAFIETPNRNGTGSPPIWRQADRLAKSMYSAVMTDLGRITLPHSSNIVANQSTLQIFSEKFPSLRNMETIIGVPTISEQVPNGTFDDLRAEVGSGPLTVTPSVISTEYLCSVPRLKSTGNIFISILLADLVLLNAVWVIYCLIVGRFFVRSATANYCEGCLSTMHELQPLKDSSRGHISTVPTLPRFPFDGTSSFTEYQHVRLNGRDSSEYLVDRADQV